MKFGPHMLGRQSLAWYSVPLWFRLVQSQKAMDVS